MNIPYSKHLIALLILLFSPTTSAGQDAIPTTTIGKTIWMVENLDSTVYQNGESITEAQSKKAWAACVKKQIGCWSYYNTDAKMGDQYGKIYNWYVASDKRNPCPKGFQVPSNETFVELEKSLSPEWGALYDVQSWKEATTGDNNSQFTALPAGVRFPNGRFDFLHAVGGWWTYEESSETTGIKRDFEPEIGLYTEDGRSKGMGRSIRCVQTPLSQPPSEPEAQPTVP